MQASSEITTSLLSGVDPHQVLALVKRTGRLPFSGADEQMVQSFAGQAVTDNGVDTDLSRLGPSAVTVRSAADRYVRTSSVAPGRDAPVSSATFRYSCSAGGSVV